MIKQALVGVFTAVAIWPVAGKAVESEKTQATMQQLFDSIRVLLPISVDQARFSDPAAKPTIRQYLRRLSDSTATLAEHVANADAGSKFLGRSLANYTTEIYRHYESGDFGRARALVQRTTTFCVDCHSRLPAARDSDLAQAFVSQGELATLPLGQRAELLVATRQFNAAMETYEQVLLDRSIHPASLIAGPLTDYLILCIRVKGDLSRPLAALESLQNRSDLWRELRDDIQHWISQLRSGRDQPKQAPSLQRARKLMDAAVASAGYLMSRRPMVQYVLASGELNRLVTATNRNDTDAHSPDMAEAYYLLGLAEYRIGRDFWVLQGDHYLETAIRLAPDRLFARRAYALIEEQTIFGYSGSSGTHIPEDVQQYLDELRDLVDRHQAE